MNFECVEIKRNEPKLEDIIDLDELGRLLDGFSQISRFPVAILNLEGEVLLQSYWSALCTKFHRVNPDTAEKCRKSDTHFYDELVENKSKFVLYKCENGLYDAASPIMVDGHHLGNFFVGQFLLEEPDQKVFTDQAQKYGFSLDEYLDALAEVPVISDKELKIRLDYLTGFTEFLGNIGLKKVQRDKALEALRESEKRYRHLFENVNEAIIIVQDGRVLFNNSKAEVLFGYSLDELSEKEIFDLIHPEDRALVVERHFQRLLGADLPDKYIFRVLRRDNAVIWVELSVSLIEWEGKAATINILNDVTAQKKAELKIESSLKEKEILLQEIHHRVKNNLTVVSSLLNLQAKNVNDAETLKILKESQSRVFAMAAVHETLYRSDSLVEIDLKSYLNKISQALIQTYAVNPTRIVFAIQSENIYLNVGQASPIGLTINELITNSLKYAFLNDKSGNITIRMRKQDREVELTVMDNGVGIPLSLDWRNTGTLGLRLVRNLVEEQLDGSVDMEVNNGTRFIIKFNVEGV